MQITERSLTAYDTDLQSEYVAGSVLVLLCDASLASFSFSLPEADCDLNLVIIKKTESGTNTITANPKTGESVDGDSSLVLGQAYECVWLYPDGSNWHVVASAKSVATIGLFA